MKHLIIIPIISLLAGCATRGDPRLSGSFISDKSTTMAYLESTDFYETKNLELLSSMFGKLEVTFEGLTVTTTMDDYTETKNFSILESGPSHVTIKSGMGLIDDMGNEIMVTHRLEFTDDGYWVMGTNTTHPFKEKFIRK